MQGQEKRNETSTMAGRDIYFFWSRGFPLTTAYYRLAPKEQKERYLELSKATSFVAIVPRLEAYTEEVKGRSPDEFWRGIGQSEILGPTGERSNLANQLKSQLRTWIDSGKLRVFGFATPRQPTDTPVEVPADLWNSYLSWDRDYIEGNGLRIEALRVIPTHWLQDKVKRAGRPSRADEIQRAYLDLKKHNNVNFGRDSLKAISAQVQKHIVHLNPSHPDGLKGIGEKAIQLAIADDVRAEKDAWKKL
ncbi:MAG: hypothetical protein RH982_14005 [Parvibaculum sp.]|uniref:hypothetical protein n=1 Tax=Parvibaculum sp. TaxID=2024848 RepID=UPI0032ECC4AE